MAFLSVDVACGPFPWNPMFQVISLEELQGQGEQVAFVEPPLLHTCHAAVCLWSAVGFQRSDKYWNKQNQLVCVLGQNLDEGP